MRALRIVSVLLILSCILAGNMSSRAGEFHGSEEEAQLAQNLKDTTKKKLSKKLPSLGEYRPEHSASGCAAAGADIHSQKVFVVSAAAEDRNPAVAHLLKPGIKMTSITSNDAKVTVTVEVLEVIHSVTVDASIYRRDEGEWVLVKSQSLNVFSPGIYKVTLPPIALETSKEYSPAGGIRVETKADETPELRSGIAVVKNITLEY